MLQVASTVLALSMVFCHHQCTSFAWAQSVPSSASSHHHAHSHHHRALASPDTLIVHLIHSAPSTTTSNLSLQLSSDRSTDPVHPSHACEEGVSYWNDQLVQCVSCTPSCLGGGHPVKMCTRSNDLKCSCGKGAYMSVVDGKCKACSECKPGWGKLTVFIFKCHGSLTALLVEILDFML